VTGHCAGQKAVDWRALAAGADTIVILMGLAQIDTIAKELIAGGLDPATPAAMVESGTLPSQRVITASLRELPTRAATDEVSSPAIIVVGEVVKLRERIAWFGRESQSQGVEAELERVAR
jgi:siroheme synthase